MGKWRGESAARFVSGSLGGPRNGLPVLPSVCSREGRAELEVRGTSRREEGERGKRRGTDLFGWITWNVTSSFTWRRTDTRSHQGTAAPPVQRPGPGTLRRSRVCARGSDTSSAGCGAVEPLLLDAGASSPLTPQGEDTFSINRFCPTSHRTDRRSHLLGASNLDPRKRKWGSTRDDPGRWERAPPPLLRPTGGRRHPEVRAGMGHLPSLHLQVRMCACLAPADRCTRP